MKGSFNESLRSCAKVAASSLQSQIAVGVITKWI